MQVFGEGLRQAICQRFEHNAAVVIVLGLKGANASKNGFFTEIPLDTPVLPTLCL